MIKFPSIEQYRNVIRNVQHQARFAGLDEAGEPIYDHNRTLPVLAFRGTVKLHGTNAGIVLLLDEGVQFQSRERVLTLEEDNAGFASHMSGNYDAVRVILEQVASHVEVKDHVAVYGEWCGGNIQKGVAIAELPKMFVIFAVKIDGEWVNPEHWSHVRNEDARIFNIQDFPTYQVDIDFERPHLAQERMIEITTAVEECCPVGNAFGVQGIGEGVVWQPISPDFSESKFWFKVKGEKHSVSKVKTLAAVDVEAIKAVEEFVANVVTEARLEQGLDNLVREQLKPFEMSSLGDFIRWVVTDIVKEESDTIAASGFDQKKLNPQISNAARKWYITKYNTQG